MKKRQFIFPILTISLIIALGIFFIHYFIGGEKVYTYSTESGIQITKNCPYGIFSKCSASPKDYFGGHKYYLIESVEYSNAETNSGYRIGNNRKRYCFSNREEMRQVKSYNQGVFCSQDAILVEIGSCYREDGRDPGYDC